MTCPISRKPDFIQLTGGSPAPRDGDRPVQPKATSHGKVHVPSASQEVPPAGCQLTAIDHIWMEPEGPANLTNQQPNWEGLPTHLDKRVRGAKMEFLVLGAFPLQGAATGR